MVVGFGVFGHGEAFGVVDIRNSNNEMTIPCSILSQFELYPSYHGFLL